MKFLLFLFFIFHLTCVIILTSLVEIGETAAQVVKNRDYALITFNVDEKAEIQYFEKGRILILSSYPCSALKMFFCFVKAVDEMKTSDNRFNISFLLKKVDKLNAYLTQMFESRVKELQLSNGEQIVKKDFITLIFWETWSKHFKTLHYIKPLFSIRY
ncbi:hypothetical protein HMI54_005873 [Coelomomyces lativittatus]|nr:hypothetical protein HMI54_005873 [Coelomomyces lativittatus]KAJ1514219.1 hypothetical protein HMI56_000912 [Coelomomyces lativittatus]